MSPGGAANLRTGQFLVLLGVGLQQHEVAGLFEEQQLVVGGAEERGVILADVGPIPGFLAGRGLDAAQCRGGFQCRRLGGGDEEKVFAHGDGGREVTVEFRVHPYLRHLGAVAGVFHLQAEPAKRDRAAEEDAVRDDRGRRAFAEPVHEGVLPEDLAVRG